jgi:hypothetical protein
MEVQMAKPNTGKPKEIVGDGSMSAESTPVAEKTTNGGSAYGNPAAMQVEGEYLRRPGMTFQESPTFGQRYVSQKARGNSAYDVALRIMVWCFDVRGFHDVSTVTTPIDGEEDGADLLLDYYPMVRAMGKRGLKYKHTPTNLTLTTLPVEWMNAYYALIANLATILNLNRLSMWNPALSVVTQYFPTIMSKVNRLWRRASALYAPVFVREHAIRNGHVVAMPGFTCPVVRFWNWDHVLATASGGPTRSYALDDPYTVLTDATKLSNFVTNLVDLCKWLETGTATIVDDFTGLMDIVDMTFDIPDLANTWAPGLPKASDLPGLSYDIQIINDLFARTFTIYDDQATDQYAIFPIPGNTVFGSRVPVTGWGDPLKNDLYDHTLLGAAKYGVNNDSLTAKQGTTAQAFRMAGTDVPIGGNEYLCTTATALDKARMFGTLRSGATSADEQLVVVGYPDSVISEYWGLDWDSAAQIRAVESSDSTHFKHIWATMSSQLRDSWASGRYARIVEEARTAYIHYVENPDFGQNYASYLGIRLAVPYMDFRG